MKKNIIIVLFLGIAFIIGFYVKRKFYDPKHRLEIAKKEIEKLIDNHKIQNGDLIFQMSTSRQSKAIQLATHSRYSHCGLIYIEKNQIYVFEAVQPVKKTPLDEWISRGKDGHFIIKRLKNSEQILTDTTLQKMKNIGHQFEGKNYDLVFEWSDDKIYCSELIWKIYKRAAGIEIGKLERLKDFDLSDETVKEKIKERYGDKIPMNEIVISPKAIFESEVLTTIAMH